MKIKTRLMITNALIIFTSLFLLSFIIWFTINNFQKNYYNIDNLTVDTYVSDIEEIFVNNDQISKSVFEKIKKEIEKYHYNLILFEDDNLLYGKFKNINEGIKKIVENYDLENGETKIIFVDTTTIVMKSFTDKLLVAISESVNSEFIGASKGHFQIFILRFILVNILSIIIILSLASIFSRRIIKKVMKPVDLLIKGAKRIQNGNLEEPIIYDLQDEFYVVCENFNNMQKHLKAEKEKNRIFEANKQEIINGLQHDIRTPLTAVKGYLKGIQDGVANTKGKQSKYLAAAYNKTFEIEILLDKLFGTYGIETLNLNKVKTNLKDYLENFILKHENELYLEKVEINLNTPSVNLYVDLDQDQIERVLNNLISNSMKYSQAKPLKIDIDIWQEKSRIYLSFKDNGKGVSSQAINQIFDEFWREDESRNPENKGNGLGLYIVKNIIEHHNGEVTAKNKNGLLIEMIFPRSEKDE